MSRKGEPGSPVRHFRVQLGANTAEVNQNSSGNQVVFNKEQVRALLEGFKETDPHHELLRAIRDSEERQWKPSILGEEGGGWTSMHKAWVASGIVVVATWTTAKQ
jgi:hypothetical protein